MWCLAWPACEQLRDPLLELVVGTAAGQTGSGKTYTIMGAKEHPGVISLAIDDLFAAVEPLPADACRLKVGTPPSAASGFQRRLNVLLACSVATAANNVPAAEVQCCPAFQVDMLELYNEELRDLLAPALDRRRKQSLQIQVSCLLLRADPWPLCSTWAAACCHVT